MNNTLATVHSLASLTPLIQILLSFTAIVSLYSKSLKNLASHGKTRQQGEGGTATTTKQEGGLHQQMKYVVTFFIDDNIFQISKRRFVDFYQIGILWTSFLLLMYCHHGMDRNFLHRNLCGIIILYLHLSRRIFECKYVHIWNGTMHGAGWLLGILHYLLFPLVFIPTINEMNEVKVGQAMEQFVDKRVQLFIFVLMNLFFQYEQYMHHHILAKSRQIYMNRNCDQKGSMQYTIPFGRWFQYVSCPHYTAEIMIYFTFACIVSITKDKNLYLSVDANSLWLFLLHNREWVLVLWVFTNLTVSAKNSHTWYRSNFGEKFPKKRKALIPFIW